MISGRRFPAAGWRLAGVALGLLAIVVVASGVRAGEGADKLDRGPAVGEALPHPLTATDQTGAARDFASIRGERGLILLFSRSLDWCVYCKAQARAWNKRLDEAGALGYGVAIVTYDSVAKLAHFAARGGIRYTLLSDPESEIIRAFGTLNERHRPGSYAYGIAHPIIFVVDAEGVIRHRFSEEYYADRPEIDLVLEAIRKDAQRRVDG